MHSVGLIKSNSPNNDAPIKALQFLSDHSYCVCFYFISATTQGPIFCKSTTSDSVSALTI